jgi:tetratricopeptide (TPR) repeat protein
MTFLALPATPSQTSTPTFDVSNLRTSTPGAPAVCPQIYSKVIPTLEYNGQYQISVDEDVFLGYINELGVDAFLSADRDTRNELGEQSSRVILYQDLTNDGAPEIVISFGGLFILGCEDGKYQALLAVANDPTFDPAIAEIQDLNLNGIPELLMLMNIGTQGVREYQMYEWGNGKFNSLFSLEPDPRDNRRNDTVTVLFDGEYSFPDTNQDGLMEFFLYDGYPLLAEFEASAPWRRMTKTFEWNGETFMLSKQVFDPPQYRFQAVEDADYATLAGEYERAIELYRQVTEDDQLEWWSAERGAYLYQEMYAKWAGLELTATPPAPDPNEYLSLTAYAQFRIMILHYLQGNELEAQSTYLSLLTDYPNGEVGAIYAQMAREFRRNFHITQSVGNACVEALAVAIEHRDEVTRYLLDNYKNDGYPQKYTFEQLCPFR